MQKASYGSKTYLVDVTDKITNNGLTLGNDYNSVLQDPCFGVVKELHIEGQGFSKVSLKENTPFTLNKNSAIYPPLFLVYSCKAKDEELVLSQVESFSCSGLSALSTLYIEICGEGGEKLRSTLLYLFPEAFITLHEEETPEYFGTLRLWQLGQEQGNAFVLYCLSSDHTRVQSGKRNSLDKDIFAELVSNWSACVDILNLFSSLNKLGWRAGRQGWIWHNVFWVKTSYLKECEKPVLTKNKYYYEYWLARRVRNPELVQTETVLKSLNNSDYILSLNDCCSMSKEKCNIGESYYD
ncbi:Hypothetical protein BQ3484_302 [Cedratvirus A11]|uniref:Uncharacterized protein n=1 Tax=Cedratvirus A11 TaxID=1903266 RepID=A0A1M7XUX0_9VIRU|nr:Hypothetical protein BQ3484_302 [Cedratvirus A11]SHO33370.1 Hypothetical protein BQ3484_302 [Cedratvirus A11]